MRVTLGREGPCIMPSQTPSSFCHIVIPAPDLEKAQHFYESVFGWSVQPNEPGPRYWFFKSGNVHGAFNASSRPANDSVVLVLRVSDIDTSLALVEATGGTVIRGRESIGKAS